MKGLQLCACPPLLRLVRRTSSHKSAQILVWADFPRFWLVLRLKDAAQRLAVPDILEHVDWRDIPDEPPITVTHEDGHTITLEPAPFPGDSPFIDVQHWYEANARFPTANAQLKDLAEYHNLNVPTTSPVQSGLEAASMYLQYGENSARRATLKRKLLAYNADDLRATVAVVRKLTSW